MKNKTIETESIATGLKIWLLAARKPIFEGQG